MYRTSKDIWSIVERRIRQNSQHYTHCEVRIALDKNEENPLCYCRIDFCRVTTMPEDIWYDYGDFALIRKSMKMDGAMALLSTLKNDNKLKVDDRLEFPMTGQFSQDHYFIPSGGKYAKIEVPWPTYYFYARLLPSHGVQRDYIVHKAKLPPYPTKTQAIIDFMGILPHLVQVDRELILIMSDFRARIKELSLIGNRLDVEVEGDGFKDKDLAVKFYCRRGNEKRHHSKDDIPVVDRKATFTAPFEPDSAEAILISVSENEMLDQKAFGRWHLEQKGIVIKTPQSHITEIIAKGESKTVEFKRSLNDMPDVLETIVSFANTEGGMILVGVDDRKNIVGFHDKRDDAEKSILGSIQGNCEPYIDTELEWVELGNQPIMIIRVPVGTNKPHNLKNNGIYVREGKDDYHIDRQTLDEIYRSKSSTSSASWM